MIREIVDEMIAKTLKSGNHTELDIWRSIKTAFVNYKTAKANNELTDDVEIQIISKMISQRKDSIEQYTQANRLDLAQKEQDEANILASLLPKEPTNEEVKSAVNEAILKIKSEKPQDYKISMRDMKEIMSIVKVKYPTVNGSIISKILKEFI